MSSFRRIYSTYRSEDNPHFKPVGSLIARFMSDHTGVEISPEQIRWETCTDEESLYSADYEMDESIYSVWVKKVKDSLEVIDFNDITLE